jgi:hypothetical protein
MYEVKADPARNLVVITFLGHVEPAQVARGRAEVVAALETMKPEFRLLTDFTELDAMDFACAPEIQTTMDLLREKGVAKVVRVVPDPKKDIGFKVMSHFHYGRAIPVLTCETRAEALEKLSA